MRTVKPIRTEITIRPPLSQKIIISGLLVESLRSFFAVKTSTKRFFVGSSLRTFAIVLSKFVQNFGISRRCPCWYSYIIYTYTYTYLCIYIFNIYTSMSSTIFLFVLKRFFIAYTYSQLVQVNRGKIMCI